VGYVDHVVIAVPDLDASAQRWQDAAGLAFTRGGMHPGGTANCIGLFAGQELYLELITVRDRDSDNFWTRLARDRHGPLTWAIGTDDLDRDVSLLVGAGLLVGSVTVGRRRCPDGTEVSWRSAVVEPETMCWPFLIEWPAAGPARLGVPAPPPRAGKLRVDMLTVLVPDPEAVARLFTTALKFSPVPSGHLAVTDGDVTIALKPAEPGRAEPERAEAGPGRAEPERAGAGREHAGPERADERAGREHAGPEHDRPEHAGTECFGSARAGPISLALRGGARGSFTLDGLTVSVEPERTAT
jgi:catechol 2,3-dioxygenase-like lactoylglutathione lyase family enzyme